MSREGWKHISSLSKPWDSPSHVLIIKDLLTYIFDLVERNFCSRRAELTMQLVFLAQLRKAIPHFSKNSRTINLTNSFEKTKLLKNEPFWNFFKLVLRKATMQLAIQLFLGQICSKFSHCCDSHRNKKSWATSIYLFRGWSQNIANCKKKSQWQEDDETKSISWQWRGYWLQTVSPSFPGIGETDVSSSEVLDFKLFDGVAHQGGKCWDWKQAEKRSGLLMRKTTQRVIKEHVTCNRVKNNVPSQPTTDLPTERFSTTKIFSKAAVKSMKCIYDKQLGHAFCHLTNLSLWWQTKSANST